jgi:hypothetical protein
LFVWILLAGALSTGARGTGMAMVVNFQNEVSELLP